MSRFAFFKIVATQDNGELEDIHGYALFDWENHGVVGYDEGLQSYFANLDGSWGIGSSPDEIPTVADLQRKLCEAFQGTELPFKEEGLRMLADGVEASPIILSPLEASLPNQARR
ncbi:TPA: hypothetical protein ACPWS4_006595 [Pseudomonas aeruginosa]